MNRREFIKTAILLSALGTQIPLMAFGNRQRQIQRRTEWETDRIILLIKLNGGNDGLNTVVPIEDDIYYDARPNLAIPSDQTLLINETTGLHPNMSPIYPYYQSGHMGIIHGVGYEQANLSHFRSSDIWATGSNSNEHIQTGWLGRLFENIYPEFPNNSPNQPLAIQLNSTNLLEFKTSLSNTGMMAIDPEQMHSIISDNYAPGVNNSILETYNSHELAYIREVDNLTMEYSSSLYESVQAGINTVEYPDNDIGTQMSFIARLISGGLNTPVYKIYQNGYDTHINQAYSHANLLQNISSGIANFLQDLINQNLQDRVLVLITSEFGRRVNENADLGTDHGTIAPCFIFGSSIVPEIFGTNPNLSDLITHHDAGSNDDQVQYDFRQIYASIINDWFGLPESVIQSVFGNYFERIPFVQEPLSVVPPSVPNNFKMHPAFPNPFNPITSFNFELFKISNVIIRVIDQKGRLVYKKYLGRIQAGSHKFNLDAKNWSSGIYFIQLEVSGNRLLQKISLVK